MPRGESLYAIPGTYSWVCPDRVTSVSVVCVGGGGGAFIRSSSTTVSGGGGGLAYKNNISTTPGNSYTVVVGVGGLGSHSDEFVFFAGGNSKFAFGATTLCEAGGGQSWQGSVGTSPPGGGVVVGDGGGSGGTGRGQNGAPASAGGAGGYSGNGGNGVVPNSAGNAGTGGAGGSGAASVSFGVLVGASGGVGVFGAGTSGAGGAAYSGNGGGGSGGAAGVNEIPNQVTYNPMSSKAGLFGAGGSTFVGATNYVDYAGSGASGAVRIVWQGDTRQFPSTDVGTP